MVLLWVRTVRNVLGKEDAWTVRPERVRKKCYMKLKKVLALSTALAIVFSNSQVVSAQEMPDVSEPEYLEYHYQVNFDDLDVFIVNGATFDIASDDGQAMDAKTAEAVDALMLSLSECSEVEEGIVSMLNDNQQLAVVSFTEAPLLWEDDHYDRVKAADITEYYKDNDNNRSKKGEFTLFTAVFRSSELDSNGKHKYTTRTYGAWNKNSAVGGENYPDSGVDYVLQSAPSTWFRTQDDWMSANYDNTPYSGVSGDDFWSDSGSEDYIRYAIKDDPYEFAKARQNKNFMLTSTWLGNPSTSMRKIHSYYVHTWESLTISVSISINNKYEKSLTITPSMKEKQWQLYNDLDFDF